MEISFHGLPIWPAEIRDRWFLETQGGQIGSLGFEKHPGGVNVGKNGTKPPAADKRRSVQSQPVTQFFAVWRRARCQGFAAMRWQLPESACAIAGFSQGAEVALHVGLRWPRRFSGLVGYSGLLAGAEHLERQIRSRPPVLLIHGDLDNVIPVEAMFTARDTLKRCGVPVEAHVAQGLGHSIDRQGAAIGGRFLKSVLPSGMGLF